MFIKNEAFVHFVSRSTTFIPLVALTTAFEKANIIEAEL